MQKSRVALVILDGWGIGPDYPGNAIKQAHTPTFDMLMATCPHTELIASGESVGLPGSEDGNTETGHLNFTITSKFPNAMFLNLTVRRPH